MSVPIAEGLGSLPVAVRALREVLDQEPGRELDELLRRLQGRHVRILVLGEAKRGKSSLVNALIGRDLLPVGVVPVTTVAATVVSDVEDYLEVRLADGRTQRCELGDVADFATQERNPGNERGVLDLRLHLMGAALVDCGAELVDTPGFGSVFAEDTDHARAALRTMDVAVLVLTADAPMSAAESELLVEAAAASATVICVLNKIDRLKGADRVTAIDFVANQARAALGRDVPVIPVSCTSPQATGLDPLRARLRVLAEAEGVNTLSNSTVVRVKRIGQAEVDRLELQLRVLELEQQGATHLIDRFQSAVSQAQGQADLVPERLEAAGRRIRRGLDADASDVNQRLQKLVAGRATSLLDGPLRDLAPKAREIAAMEGAEPVIREVVDGWAATEGAWITSALEDVLVEEHTRSDAVLAQLRDTADELLGVTLVLDPERAAIRPTTRYFYDFQPPPSQTELVAGPLRHVLPGGLGERRVARFVLKECRTQSDKHVGRMRADLQERLTEAVRALSRVLQHEQAAVIAALSEAVGSARAAGAGVQSHALDATVSLSGRLERVREAVQHIEDVANGIQAEAFRHLR